MDGAGVGPGVGRGNGTYIVVYRLVCNVFAHVIMNSCDLKPSKKQPYSLEMAPVLAQMLARRWELESESKEKETKTLKNKIKC